MLFFDVQFNLSSGYNVHFSTGPQSDPTHWKQTVLNLKEPFKVQTGTVTLGFTHALQKSVKYRIANYKLLAKLLSANVFFVDKDRAIALIREMLYLAHSRKISRAKISCYTVWDRALFVS